MTWMPSWSLSHLDEFPDRHRYRMSWSCGQDRETGTPDVSLRDQAGICFRYRGWREVAEIEIVALERDQFGALFG